jgi:hypothetical protein
MNETNIRLQNKHRCDRRKELFSQEKIELSITVMILDL